MWHGRHGPPRHETPSHIGDRPANTWTSSSPGRATSRRPPSFVRNIRRGHYELGLDTEPHHRLTEAFTELTLAIIRRPRGSGSGFYRGFARLLIPQAIRFFY